MAWHLMNSGGKTENYGYGHKEFMLDNPADINKEPEDQGKIAIGSLAYTSGFAKVWHKGADKEWHEV